MTIFKGYLLIIKRNLPLLLAFVVVFFAISVFIGSESSDTDVSFSAKSLDIALVDQDGSTLSEGLFEMLKSSNNVIMSDGDKSALTEELYARSISYVITVPKGYEEDFVEAVNSGSNYPALLTTGVPESTEGYYLDSILSTWLDELRLYLAGGYDISKAIELTGELEDQVDSVEIMEPEEDKNDHVYANMLRFLPYLYLAVICYATMFIKKAFNDKEISNRLHCSSIPPAKQTVDGLLAFCVLYGVIWIVTILIPVFSIGAEYLRSPYFKFYLLNSLCMMLSAVGIGQLASLFTGKNDAAISGMTNIISLGMSFLCGVFVPLEYLGEGVKKVASVLPVYWYEVADNALKNSSAIDSALTLLVRKSCLIQLIFAVVLVALTVLIQKLRSRK